MWVDKQLYWAWDKPIEYEIVGHLKVPKPIPPTPTKKKLDYVTINKGCVGAMRLCIGVWDDEKYTPLYRDELEFHTKQYR